LALVVPAVKAQSAWLAIYQNGDYGRAIATIEMENMVQCEKQGKIWRREGRGFGAACLRGKGTKQGVPAYR